jgi:hypothetical protein
LLESVAQQREFDERAFGWMARVGTVFSGIVELVVPGSVCILLSIRWLSPVYAFEALLIVSATLPSAESTLCFGWSFFLASRRACMP